MNWTERTFWLKENDGKIKQALVVDEGVEEILNLEESGVEVVQASKTAPCSTCPHIQECMSSRWADSQRAGGPVDAPISIVHTCATCCDFVLSIPGEKRIVARECPRWWVDFASAQECVACGREASDVLTEDRILKLQSERLITELLVVLEQDFPVMDTLDEEYRQQLTTKCLPGVYSTLRAENPEAIAHEFMLEFVHDPKVSPSWFAKTSGERRIIRRIWGCIVRQNLERIRDPEPDDEIR